MTRNALAALALVAAMATAGCSSTSGKADSEPPSGSNADKSSAAASPSAKASKNANPKFGEAFTWKDGLSVKVSKPRPFKPSEYAAGSDKGQAIRFTFTVINKTDKPYDPSLFSATLQSGNAEAEEIFDNENGLEGSPSTKVLAGREAKFDLGFSVKNPKDLVLELSPDAGIQYESAIFTS
jgi:hypothetical protein